jgi:hypothetical protein
MVQAMLTSGEKDWYMNNYREDWGDLGEIDQEEEEEQVESSSGVWKVQTQPEITIEKVVKAEEPQPGPSRQWPKVEDEVKFVKKKISPFQNRFWVNAQAFRNFEFVSKYNPDIAITHVYVRQKIKNLKKYPVLKFTPCELGDVVSMLLDIAEKIKFPEFKLKDFEDNGEIKLNAEAFWDKSICLMSRSQ